MHTIKKLVSESIELITLPDVYIQLRNVINSPHTSMADVAEVIASDPATTARLLKLVNSSFFNLAAKVDTITHAINMLGTQQVHDLVLATSVIDSFSGFDNDHFNLYDFWFNGIYCAVTARLLAFYCKNADTERPFVAGLLHDIGHLISYQKIPEESLAAIDLATQRNISIHMAEREILGFDYAQLGAELMRNWQLPKSLQEITEFHLEPEKAGEYLQETAIIHIASGVTKNALAGIPVSPDTLAIDPLCWEITGLFIEEMPNIKNEADLQASMLMNLFFTSKKSA